LSSKNSNSVSVLRGEHIYIFGGYNNSRMVNKYYINDSNIETLTDLEYNVNGSYGYGFLGDDIYFIYQTNLHKYNIPYAINNLIFNLPVSKYESVATFDSNYKSLLILGGAKKDNISKFNVIQELLKDHIHIITTLNYNKVNLVENENTVVRVGIDKIFCGNSSNIGETISGYIYDTTTNTWVDIKNTKLINI
ncbi:MAG: hypothetical protein IJW82_05860, partial [Clostridia bacterium]|nr:hypothetical protein [Clostridia bacterium]